MAQRKRQSRRPQAQHKKSRASRHDKRARLGRPNRQRRRTTRAKIPLCGALSAAIAALAAVLDRRMAFRLAIIVAVLLLADDRRTASAWFVAAGVHDDWDRFYDCLISIGRSSRQMAAVVLGLVVTKFAPGPGDRILVGLDDTPWRKRCQEPMFTSRGRFGTIGRHGKAAARLRRWLRLSRPEPGQCPAVDL
jgi:hypothetical protein